MITPKKYIPKGIQRFNNALLTSIVDTPLYEVNRTPSRFSMDDIPLSLLTHQSTPIVPGNVRWERRRIRQLDNQLTAAADVQPTVNFVFQLTVIHVTPAESYISDVINRQLRV
jgi:hypothetical protein